MGREPRDQGPRVEEAALVGMVLDADQLETEALRGLDLLERAVGSSAVGTTKSPNSTGGTATL